MISKSLAQPALLALVTCLGLTTGVFAQDRSRDDQQSRIDRYFDYMDQNKNGRIDGDETRRLGFMRDALERAEIDISRGVSKDQFARAMEDARRRREEEYRNRSSDDRRSSYYRRDDSRRSDDRRRNDESKKKSSYVYKPSRRQPVTMKIPRNYEDADTDKDGQIGLYEWRQWRPDQKYHFRVYDINGDGFLTPKELSIPPTQEEVNNYLTSIGMKVDTSSSSRYGRDRGYRNNSSGSSGASLASSAPQQSKPVEKFPENDRYAKAALVFFNTLDVNKDGKITSEEWPSNSRLKPKFEDAGIDLSQSMDQQQFIAACRKAYSKS